jgi:hypothetical protein
MDECMIDYALADEVIDLYVVHDGIHGIARALQLVAAVAKNAPPTSLYDSICCIGCLEEPPSRSPGIPYANVPCSWCG